MDSRLKKLGLSLDSIAIFRNILRDETVRSMRALISSLSGSDTGAKLRRYSAFVEALYSQTVNFSEYVLKLVFEDDNIFIRQTAQGGDIDTCILEAAENELRILQELSQISPDDIAEDIGWDGALPQWRTCGIDFLAEYKWRRENISRFGYGKYSRSTVFRLAGGETVPVMSPDTQRSSELFGYESERQAVIENTLALADGKRAQPLLIYGGAGTGKTAAVRAAVNEYYDRGLRLIEVTAEQLRDIPQLIGELSADPLRFIIFIDDLPADMLTGGSGALSAALGSAERSHNTVIYAACTGSAEGLEWQGKTVEMPVPDKECFIRITAAVAKQNGIELPDEELALRAEQSAQSGLSPRAARQLIDQMINER